MKWFYWLKFKFRETPLAEFSFLENQISLAALTQVSRPHTYDKRTFTVVAHWHFLLSELRHQTCQSLVFHSETPSCKTPTNLTADGYSAQPQVFESLNPGTPALFTSHLQPKEVISVKPVQGLNPNRRSISCLETESPVTISVFNM
jgi:hypothetical protein